MTPVSSRRALAGIGASAVLLAGLLAVVPHSGVAVTSQTIHVTTTQDYALSKSGDPAVDCRPSKCSFRAALEKSDCAGGGATVDVPAGDYKIDPTQGPPVIAQSVTVVGASARSVVLDGQKLTSVLAVDPSGPGLCGNSGTTTGSVSASPVTVAISGLAIENGASISCGAPIRGAPTRRVPLGCSSGVGGLSAFDGQTSATLVLDHVTVANNSGSQVGGLLLDNSSTTLRSVTVSGNQGQVGGISSVRSLLLVNTTLSGNGGPTSTVGALEMRCCGSATLEWSTISGNTGATGGIANGSEGPAHLAASIVSANSLTNCSGFGSFASRGQNIEDRNECGFSQTSDQHDVDPKLEALGNYGGAVNTMALQQGSPAIDRVVAPCAENLGTRGTPIPLTVDARDQGRPADAGCDVGAFERVGPDPGTFTKGPQPPPGGFAPELPTFVIPKNAPDPWATTLTDGANTVTLSFPKGALPDETRVAVYHGNGSQLNSSLPSGQASVDGYAVAWATPENTRPSALKPITLSVGDANVPANGTLYQCDTTGCRTAVGQPPAHVAQGSWSVPFTADPGFVLAEAAAAPPATAPPTQAAAPAVTFPTVGAAPAERPGLGGPIVIALAGLLLMLTAALVGRRRQS